MLDNKKDLSNQNLSSIEDKGKIFEQKHLKELNASYNQIKVGTDKEEKVYVEGKVVVEDVRYDGITEDITNLSELEVLDLSHNQIVEIPEYLTQMTTLKELDMSYNEGIEKIPNNLSNLINLEKLNLVGTKVSKIKGFNKNKSPKEIIEFLLFNQNKEKELLNEAKILVLGDENSGKSSLVERMVHDTFREEYVSTKGIDIEEYWIDNIKVKIWDFAGQEITYQVHNLFMSQESLYLLVIDGQKENDIKEHFNWLETIGANAGYPPVIIVVTKHENNRAYKLDEAEYTNKFENIKSFHYVSSKTEEGIDELKEKISSETKELAKIQILSECVPIKKEIENRDKNDILEASEFRTICKKHSIDSKEERANIRRILNDTGTIIGLDRDDKHVTNPASIIDDIYKIIRSTAINDRGEKPLDDPDDNNHNWIIQFLLKNNIALKIDNNRVLIPSRLPVNRPENFKKRVYEGLPTTKQDNSVVFKSGLNFKYRYIHGFKKGILFDFIIQIYEYIKDKNPNYWANGLCWGNENLKAVVLSSTIYKTIDIHIPTCDKESQVLLTKVREEFEKIHEDSSIFVLEEIAIFKDDEIKKHIGYEFLKFKKNRKDKDVEVEINQKPYEYGISELIDRYEYVYEEVKDAQQKPLIITEGKTDKRILEIAWKKLYSAIEMPFRVQDAGLERKKKENGKYTEEIEKSGGSDVLRQQLEHSTALNQQLTIGIFDSDSAGYRDFKGLQESIFGKYSKNDTMRKDIKNNTYAILLPVPSFRQKFISSSHFDQKHFVIEHYFSDRILKEYNMKGQPILEGAEIFKIQGKKDDFSKTIETLEKVEFEHFELLFDMIKEIIDGKNSNQNIVENKNNNEVSISKDIKELIDRYNKDVPTIIQSMQNGSIENFEEIKIELAKELKNIMQQSARTWGSAQQKALKRKEYIQGLLKP